MTAGSEVRGISRLIVDGILGVVRVVEAMHATIASVPAMLAENSTREETRGITRLAYQATRGIVHLVGHTLDALLARLAPPASDRRGPRREAVLAALNGVLGDYLAASGNPLALMMHLRRDGLALPSDRDELSSAIPQASGKVVVLLHGLCMNDLQWRRNGHDHGAALSRDLGYTSIYLHYNTGLHISTNGRAAAQLLENLARKWPVPLTDLVLIGHSMGGLVARSACYYGELARHQWMRHLTKLVFIGTPHHGAPLERAGNRVDALLALSAYTAPLARLGKIRSAGITDLRFGSLVDEDWKGRDRFEGRGNAAVQVPLPKCVSCYAIAATTAKKPGRLHDRLIGDGIVPLASALGRDADPKRALKFESSRQWVVHGANHLALLSRLDVYAEIKRWLSEPG